ncbi:N-acetylneuraminate synthase family protein [Ornithinimicrobium cryptoxanthini]|uniref:N-acetylneuraminate synthase family protein n=1 Tax=Ornithinimicrobium cryptoxanthini TaxID=2934161 RepID=A0ABY4YIT0_9MICO|nr:N-acetylneuraminate synthase family protein [Ornithinimicrobium cryptoxanthini]USQ76598.1 N-acetylneuraminate synthase family protein [Ornithinimicrobium cryptoxanthini]
MIIERHLTPFVVYAEDPVLAALEKITANKTGIVFVVSEHGHLRGSLSDGDFRRWLTSTPKADLTVSAATVANPSPVTVSIDQAVRATDLFRPGVDIIPLVDDKGHVVAVALNRAAEFRIGRRAVGPESPALLIAEIGNNHNGSVETAKRLVDEAVVAGADVVKFQHRDMDSLYRQSGEDAHAGEDLGAQYTLDLLRKFNLSTEQLFEIFDHCRDRGIEVMCTPWDRKSVDDLMQWGVPALKVASADLTNHDLLTYMGQQGVPLIVSTGMSTETEIRESVEVIRSTGAPFAVLHCQSTYPAPFKDVNLRYMRRLAEIAQAPVGYSGHERGYHIPLAAIALGAKVIEKHFTIDRFMEGNDHKVSLLPGEFAEMVQRTRELEEALGSDGPRAVSTGESMNRANLAKSLVAARPVTQGELLAEQDITIKSPGRGLQPNSRAELVGRVAKRDMAEGDFFFPSDLTDEALHGRQYSFNRPWGVPVRYHDVEPLTRDCTPDFLEFHYSYKDLEIDADAVFTESLPMGYTCHVPDLFSGDFILDLASFDDGIWKRSIDELQRCIEATTSLRKWFDQPTEPVLVCTMGGFTPDRHLPAAERPRLYARIAEALERVDTNGVILTAQTLPPFPWLMGGQQFHNLFMDPRDTVDFVEQYGTRLCLDISHSKLSANFIGMPFSEAVELLAPRSDHLHIVDATGVDGEGVQIGEGEVDWPLLARQLDELAPGVMFIPEIWMGHVNNGEGFWLALERLEQWF